jgi:hypothetical protein
MLSGFATRRGSILMTSNRALEELPSIFGDLQQSSAALDRLLDDALE